MTHRPFATVPRLAALIFAVGGVLFLAHGCGSGGDTAATTTAGSSGKAGSSSAGHAGTAGSAGAAGNNALQPSQTIPTLVAGYDGCTRPACADAARACDDYLRSGCSGKVYISAGYDPGLGKGDEAYGKGIASCANALMTTIGEAVSESGGIANPEIARGRAAALISRCTRYSHTCSDMGSCFRLRLTLPSLDDPTLPPPVDAGPPEPPPYWKAPYEGPTEDVLNATTPWDGGAIRLLPGDSPSCAACTLDRCPSFAFYCFGAEGTTDCTGGDCCQSLRGCIRDCGGYGPGARAADFDRCTALCGVSRPHATQQLADLQHCATVACAKCDQFDKVQLRKAGK